MPKFLRRALIASGLVAGPLLAASPQAAAEPALGRALAATVAAIEREVGGRLGVSVRDFETGATWTHRGNERFPMASTFKAFACAHLLAESDAGRISIEKRVRFEAEDLQDHSPVTKSRTGGDGISLSELCRATTATSDNTAANLVLESTGGPAALTRFMRSIGDDTTRLDRYEPELNDVGPTETRDTTSPDAAATSLGRLLLGDRLSEGSRCRLDAWLAGNEVGGPLLRASLPDGWRIGDRTGTGAYGTRGILAVIRPTAGEAETSGPVVVAIYLTGTTLTLEKRNAVIAEVGTALVRDLREKR